MITEEEAKDEVKTAPAKRWRNKWLVVRACECGVRGHLMPGDEALSTKVYDTKAEAREQARLAAPSIDYAKFLGPFPVEEPSP